jgi:hypothetical protein
VGKRESDFSGKPLVWGAGILVLMSCGVLYALWPRAQSAKKTFPRSEPAAAETPTTTAREARTETTAAPRPAVERVPQRPAVAEPPLSPLDLFATPGPEILDVPHGIVARGETVNLMKLKEVYQYAKDHPGDARPHLVMAGDAINRGWYDQAIGHYVRAAKEDPRARQDEHMLRDLIKAAGREHSAVAAADAVAEIYGRAAVDGVRAAVDQATADDDEGRTTRLSDLLLRLEDEPGKTPVQK